MKKGGKKNRSKFKIVLTIKRPLGEFVMIAEGYSGDESKYEVCMHAHVKTSTGKLRTTIQGDADFMQAHVREIIAMVHGSYDVTRSHGRSCNWK